uniref:Uncharacterized protein n=1 Tax=Oryza brachyantha TaxID=4533 RepID=J3KW32_ORYBR
MVLVAGMAVSAMAEGELVSLSYSSNLSPSRQFPRPPPAPVCCAVQQSREPAARLADAQGRRTPPTWPSRLLASSVAAAPLDSVNVVTPSSPASTASARTKRGAKESGEGSVGFRRDFRGLRRHVVDGTPSPPAPVARRRRHCPICAPARWVVAARPQPTGRRQTGSMHPASARSASASSMASPDRRPPPPTIRAPALQAIAAGIGMQGERDVGTGKGQKKKKD